MGHGMARNHNLRRSSADDLCSSKVRCFFGDLIMQSLTQGAVLDRDQRLTGFVRGQTDNVAAPPGFELNNPWRVRLIRERWKNVMTDD